MIFRRFSDVFFRRFSDVCLSDVCPFWRLSFLTFVASDVCPFWRLSLLTFVLSDVCRSDVCPFWRLSFWRLSVYREGGDQPGREGERGSNTSHSRDISPEKDLISSRRAHSCWANIHWAKKWLTLKGVYWSRGVEDQVAADIARPAGQLQRPLKRLFSSRYSGVLYVGAPQSTSLRAAGY